MDRRFVSGESEAEFNLAAGTILRIDENLKEINYMLKIHDLKGCYESLQTIFSEIYPFLKKDEPKTESNTEKELGKKIAGSINYDPRSKRNYFNPSEELEMDLRRWDRKLRTYMLKYRLYMKMSDDRLAASKV